MNNNLTMAASFETKKNQQAMMITAGFAGLLLMLLFLVSWATPILPPHVEEPMLVELTIPDEPLPPPPPESGGGGGGGGNISQAAGPAGVSPYAPPQPGTAQDAKDIEEDPTDNTPPIRRPDVVKPDAKKINENPAPVNIPPKPDPLPPAPKPKAILTQGKTDRGKESGGGAVADYDRPGGRTGGGTGVGNGTGTGGGQGTGSGGGRGSGVGPQVTSGDRSIVGSYSFEGDLDKATIYAHVRVSPDGVGEFIQFAKQSTNTSSAYRTAITQYLRKMRFNKSDHESMVTVKFNFKVNG